MVWQWLVEECTVRALLGLQVHHSVHHSVLWLHSVYHHDRREGVEYAMRVTSQHNDALTRQVTEMVNISSFEGPVLMNRRNEMAGIRVDRQQYRRWGGE